jgi:hypothetical protein
MSFRTPVDNPGTRPPRSRVFDIACTLLAAPTSYRIPCGGWERDNRERERRLRQCAIGHAE